MCILFNFLIAVTYGDYYCVICKAKECRVFCQFEGVNCVNKEDLTGLEHSLEVFHMLLSPIQKVCP